MLVALQVLSLMTGASSTDSMESGSMPWNNNPEKHIASNTASVACIFQVFRCYFIRTTVYLYWGTLSMYIMYVLLYIHYIYWGMGYVVLHIHYIYSGILPPVYFSTGEVSWNAGVGDGEMNLSGVQRASGCQTKCDYSMEAVMGQ